MTKDERHLPLVRIETTAPPDGFVSGRGTRVFIDGVEWPVFRYEVKGAVNDMQKITLEFTGRVAFLHTEQKP
jgi:hypothetical protein